MDEATIRTSVVRRASVESLGARDYDGLAPRTDAARPPAPTPTDHADYRASLSMSYVSLNTRGSACGSANGSANGSAMGSRSGSSTYVHAAQAPTSPTEPRLPITSPVPHDPTFAPPPRSASYAPSTSVTEGAQTTDRPTMSPAPDHAAKRLPRHHPALLPSPELAAMTDAASASASGPRRSMDPVSIPDHLSRTRRTVPTTDLGVPVMEYDDEPRADAAPEGPASAAVRALPQSMGPITLAPDEPQSAPGAVLSPRDSSTLATVADESQEASSAATTPLGLLRLIIPAYPPPQEPAADPDVGSTDPAVQSVTHATVLGVPLAIPNGSEPTISILNALRRGFANGAIENPLAAAAASGGQSAFSSSKHAADADRHRHRGGSALSGPTLRGFDSLTGPDGNRRRGNEDDLESDSEGDSLKVGVGVALQRSDASKKASGPTTPNTRNEYTEQGCDEEDGMNGLGAGRSTAGPKKPPPERDTSASIGARPFMDRGAPRTLHKTKPKDTAAQQRAAAKRLPLVAAAFAVEALRVHSGNVRVAHYAVSLLAHPALSARFIVPFSSPSTPSAVAGSMGYVGSESSSGGAVARGMSSRRHSQSFRRERKNGAFGLSGRASPPVGAAPPPQWAAGGAAARPRLSLSASPVPSDTTASPLRRAFEKDIRRARVTGEMRSQTGGAEIGVFSRPSVDAADNQGRAPSPQLSTPALSGQVVQARALRARDPSASFPGRAAGGGGPEDHTTSVLFSDSPMPSNAEVTIAIEQVVCDAMRGFPFSAAFQHTALAALQNVARGDHRRNDAREEVLIAAVAALRRHPSHAGILLRGVDFIAFHLNQATGVPSAEMYRCATAVVVSSARKLSTTPQGASAVLLACVASARWSATHATVACPPRVGGTSAPVIPGGLSGQAVNAGQAITGGGTGSTHAGAMGANAGFTMKTDGGSPSSSGAVKPGRANRPSKTLVSLVDPLFCACVVSAMRKHLNVPHVQILGCETVRVAGRIAGRSLLASGAVETVLATVELHGGDIAVVDRALPALRAVVLNSTTVRLELALSSFENGSSPFGAGGVIDVCNRIAYAADAAAAAVEHISPDTAVVATALAADVRTAVAWETKRIAQQDRAANRKDRFGFKRLARLLQGRNQSPQSGAAAQSGPQGTVQVDQLTGSARQGLGGTVHERDAATPSSGDTNTHRFVHSTSAAEKGARPRSLSRTGARSPAPGTESPQPVSLDSDTFATTQSYSRRMRADTSSSAFSTSHDNQESGFMGTARARASLDGQPGMYSVDVLGDGDMDDRPQIRANRRFRSVGGMFSNKRRISRSSQPGSQGVATHPRLSRDRGNPLALTGSEVAKLARQPSNGFVLGAVSGRETPKRRLGPFA